MHPLSGAYDLAHLQAFHRFIFGNVYDWAGQLRTVSIGKGHLFCLSQHIEPSAADVFERLADSGYLRCRKLEDFLDGVSELLGDINALHPFREGNGRTQRAFLAQSPPTSGTCCGGRQWIRPRMWTPRVPPTRAIWLV